MNIEYIIKLLIAFKDMVADEADQNNHASDTQDIIQAIEFLKNLQAQSNNEK